MITILNERLEMVTLSKVSEIIAIIFLALGLIFLLAKMIFKLTKKEVEGSFYGRIRTLLYNSHKATPVLATIFAFIHGIADMITGPADSMYIITGWILGGSMILMSVMGIVMGFKNKWIPYDNEADKQNLIIRIVKWILTIVMIVFFIGHYLF